LESLANFKNVIQYVCLNSLGTEKVFLTVFFVSQRKHYIFLEAEGWCHTLLRKQGT